MNHSAARQRFSSLKRLIYDPSDSPHQAESQRGASRQKLLTTKFMGRIKLQQTLNIDKCVMNICSLPFSRSDWTEAYLNSSRWWQFVLSVLDTEVQSALRGQFDRGNNAQNTAHSELH